MKVNLMYVISALFVAVLFSGCFGFHNLYHDENHSSEHHK